MARTLGVIGVPSSAGAYAPGQETRPAALRGAGLLDGAHGGRRTVVDHGDAPVWRWRPDRDQPVRAESPAVVACASDTAERVRAALAAGEVALVLGGDCTVGIGTVAGSGRGGRVGLVYLDVHGDLNTPAASPTARSTGWASRTCSARRAPTRELREFGPRVPLLDDDQSCCSRRGTLNRHAPRAARRSSAAASRAVPREDVPADPAAAAPTRCPRSGRATGVRVHFDVDCIDFTDTPLSENTGRNAASARTTRSPHWPRCCAIRASAR